MQQLGSSAPLRLGLVVVIAVAVQYVTHASWLAIALLVTYFAVKELVGVVQPGVAAAILGGESGPRVAAFACDNAGFVAALFGFFTLQKAPPADGATLVRFAVFEAAVVVFVAIWGMIGTAALRRSSRAVKI